MISYKEIQVGDLESFTLIARWFNSPEMEHLVKANFQEKPFPQYTAKELMETFDKDDLKRYFLILHDGNPIGEVSLQIDPPHLAKNEGKSGWLGISIADPDFRGQGVASQALDFIEGVAREMGAERMELGVFAYNKRAKAFYAKEGYQEFTTLKDFTFYDGRWHDDIRMEKRL